MFDTLLYRPIFNGLVFLYNTVAFNDLGIAIILLTIAVRLILFPLFHRSTRQQLVLQKLQPKIKKIQDDHKHDREKQAKALLDFYREHKVNPFSGLFSLIIQLPILIAVYQVFSRGFSPENLAKLYRFVPAPEIANHSFLGVIDLTERSLLLVAIATVLQYVQGRLTLAPNSEKIARQMVLIAPAVTVVILFYLPAAIALYLGTMSLFSIVQQKIIMRSLHHDERLPVNSKTS